MCFNRDYLYIDQKVGENLTKSYQNGKVIKRMANYIAILFSVVL